MVVVVDGIHRAMLVHMLVHLFASYPQIQQVFRCIPRFFSCSIWPWPLFFRDCWMLVHVLVHALARAQCAHVPTCHRKFRSSWPAPGAPAPSSLRPARQLAQAPCHRLGVRQMTSCPSAAAGMPRAAQSSAGVCPPGSLPGKTASRVLRSRRSPGGLVGDGQLHGLNNSKHIL